MSRWILNTLIFCTLLCAGCGSSGESGEPVKSIRRMDNLSKMKEKKTLAPVRVAGQK